MKKTLHLDTVLETENKLIGDIYDASMNPNLWRGILQEIAELWQCEYANILISDELNPDYLIVHAHGVSPKDIEYYTNNDFTELDKSIAQGYLDAGVPLGEVSTNEQAFGSLENYVKVAGRLHTDFFDKLNIKYQLCSCLEKTDYRYSAFSLHDGKKRQKFSDAEVTSASRLTGHMHRAIQIHRQLSYIKESNAALYQLLNKMTAGILLLDFQGRIRFANPNAEKLMQSRNLLSISRNNNLKTRQDDKLPALQQLINSAIKTGLREKQDFSLTAGGVISLKDHQEKQRLMLTITPLSEMTGYQDLSSDGIAASIFITDPLGRRALSHRILKHSYLLNQRECEVCESFLNTGTITKVAEEMDLTTETIRYYLKSIYDKTRQRSQAELMRFLMGLSTDFEHVTRL